MSLQSQTFKAGRVAVVQEAMFRHVVLAWLLISTQNGWAEILSAIAVIASHGCSGAETADYFANNPQKAGRGFVFIDVDIDVLEIGWHCTGIEDDWDIASYTLQFLCKFQPALPTQHVLGNRATNWRLPKGCDCVGNVGYTEDIEAILLKNFFSELQLRESSSTHNLRGFATGRRGGRIGYAIMHVQQNAVNTRNTVRHHTEVHFTSSERKNARCNRAAGFSSGSGALFPHSQFVF
jgi:hypothetical protein